MEATQNTKNKPCSGLSDLTVRLGDGLDAYEMTNSELQAAINALLKHFSNRKGWCEGGSPDGALSDCLGKMIYEQAERAKYLFQIP